MADKKLSMVFINNANKKITISLDGIRDDVTKEQAAALMDTIISKNIFTSSGGELKAKESAEIVAKDVVELQVK